MTKRYLVSGEPSSDRKEIHAMGREEQGIFQAYSCDRAKRPAKMNIDPN